MSVGSRIEADDLIETALDPHEAAKAIAGEQSSGTCVMASLSAVGLAGMIEPGRFAQVPIHAHRNGWGALSRHPALGWSCIAWQKIWRLAGADRMHVNGLASKFAEDDDSVIASARACLSPLFDDKPCPAMPVFSSGQSTRQAHGTFAALGSAALGSAALGSTDLIFAAGGGIMAHPDGPAAGVQAPRKAWDAAIAGVALVDRARTHPAPARTLGEAA